MAKHLMAKRLLKAPKRTALSRKLVNLLLTSLVRCTRLPPKAPKRKGLKSLLIVRVFRQSVR